LNEKKKILKRLNTTNGWLFQLIHCKWNCFAKLCMYIWIHCIKNLQWTTLIFYPKFNYMFMNHKCKFPCHFITWNVVSWTFESSRMHQFSKVHFGMRMKHLKKVFMNNEYKNKKSGFPMSILKKLKCGFPSFQQCHIFVIIKIHYTNVFLWNLIVLFLVHSNLQIPKIRSNLLWDNSK